MALSACLNNLLSLVGFVELGVQEPSISTRWGVDLRYSLRGRKSLLSRQRLRFRLNEMNLILLSSTIDDLRALRPTLSQTTLHLRVRKPIYPKTLVVSIDELLQLNQLSSSLEVPPLHLLVPSRRWTVSLPDQTLRAGELR
jgi:hypothetical protein